MAGTQIPLAMQMVIKRFNFDWSRDQHGNFRVEDPVIRSFYTGTNRRDRNGVYTDRKLDVAVQAAVAIRKEHDTEMTKRSGFSTEPVKVEPAKPVTPAPAPKRKRPTRQEQRNELRALVSKKAAPAAVSAPVITAPVAHKSRVLIDDSPIDAEIEIDADDLDNTGQRERNRVEEAKTGRKRGVSMYERTAPVLLKRPGITAEGLAVQTKMSPATAERCILAWRDILNVLNHAGCLTAAGKRLIPTKKGAAQ